MRKLGIAFLVVLSLAALTGRRALFGQSCDDDEAMVKDYQKSLTEIIGTVKKESLADFEKAYHQKVCMTKLTFCLTTIDGLVECLDKASQDAATPKDQAEAAKSKRETYTKLKGKIQEARTALKSAEAPKDAKALIEKFDFSN
ncbi:MAG TPA: hypothetical protein VKM93_12145 [Terriglobia bacterium]|nr:hypothetical protein [Terriglobia bacterium]